MPRKQATAVWGAIYGVNVASDDVAVTSDGVAGESYGGKECYVQKDK